MCVCVLIYAFVCTEWIPWLSSCITSCCLCCPPPSRSSDWICFLVQSRWRYPLPQIPSFTGKHIFFLIIFLSNNNNIFKMILRVLSWGTSMSLFYNLILFLSSSSRIVCQKTFYWMLSTLNSSTVSMKSGLMLTKPLTTIIMPPCSSLFVALDLGKGPILLGFVFSV